MTPIMAATPKAPPATQRLDSAARASPPLALHDAERGRRAEGPHGDPEVGQRESRLPRAQRARGVTVSVACMTWWDNPQYSLQTIRYSPGFSKTVVNSLTYPGITIVFAFVPTI